jgi:hypothetical protein
MRELCLADVAQGSEAVFFGLAELVRFVPDRYIKSDIVDVGFKATKRTAATSPQFR